IACIGGSAARASLKLRRVSVDRPNPSLLHIILSLAIDLQACIVVHAFSVLVIENKFGDREALVRHVQSEGLGHILTRYQAAFGALKWDIDAKLDAHFVTRR